jgi:FkbM family methyltransferase
MSLTFRYMGARFLNRPGDEIVRAIQRRGGFEREDLAFVQRLLRPGDAVLDLGANFGIYTVLAASAVRPAGRVLAVEPNARMCWLIRLHTVLNGLPNVRVCRAAVGGQCGRARLHVPQQPSYGSLSPDGLKGPCRTVSVRALTLDALVERYALPSARFVKLDVEGAELDVLRHGSRVLSGPRRPVLLTEVCDRRTRRFGYAGREILTHLAGLDYGAYRIRDGRLAPHVIESAYEDGENIVSVPREARDELAAAGLLAS